MMEVQESLRMRMRTKLSRATLWEIILEAVDDEEIENCFPVSGSPSEVNIWSRAMHVNHADEEGDCWINFNELKDDKIMELPQIL